MRVIGTAGHVDHGKSTLVLALTGINPDRLREEQERQMTIDLGFAWMTLPAGEEVGIIDVPGHRDFIENMLAGVGGIDAALLVIAADEGVMPQTREHLAILDLLQVHRSVVALAKIDLVHEPHWLDLVREEIEQLLEHSGLSGSPIVPVSSTTGEGLEQLKHSLEQVLSAAAPRPDLGRPRLPVDRAFSIAGFGTVVTGTLVDGALEVGQEVQVLPGGQRARVRGLQTHKSPVQSAVVGSRVAANLTGIEVRQIRRGDVLVQPDSEQATTRLDVRFRLLADAPQRIRHNQAAKLFLGAAQRGARVRLLGAQELSPGDQGWLQLELEEPVVARRGDHYILRRASPSATCARPPTRTPRIRDAGSEATARSRSCPSNPCNTARPRTSQPGAHRDRTRARTWTRTRATTSPPDVRQWLRPARHLREEIGGLVVFADQLVVSRHGHAFLRYSAPRIIAVRILS